MTRRRASHRLEIMSSTGNSDIQRILADVMANRPYSHRQNVDPTVVAVVTVEEDMRFLPDTMGALLRQTVLPGVIVIADCARRRQSSGAIAVPGHSCAVGTGQLRFRRPRPSRSSWSASRAPVRSITALPMRCMTRNSTRPPARSGCCLTIHGRGRHMPRIIAGDVA